MRDRLKARGIADVEIQPGKSGQFDVTVDGALKYSRYQTGRFPADAEVDGLVSP